MSMGTFGTAPGGQQQTQQVPLQQGQQKHHPFRTPEMQECIANCLDCSKECENCAAMCVGMPGMEECVRACMDCATTCQSCVSLMCRESPLHGHMCGVCAEACTRCAAECEKFEDEHCERCAVACRKCTDSCARMAQMAGGMQAMNA